WVGPVFVPVVAETVTLDKWQSYSVGPFPPPPYPSSVFAWGVFTPAPVVPIDRWLTDSPRQVPVRPTQQAVYASPAFFDQLLAPVGWLTDSPIQAPARKPQNIGAFAWNPNTPVIVEGAVTLDKWLAYDARPRFFPRVVDSSHVAPLSLEPGVVSVTRIS